MNRAALAAFSYFDSVRNPSMETQPERFYHGFVLGLTVELAERYVITSNRGSGIGRYNVMMEPKSGADNAVVMEFKVRDSGIAGEKHRKICQAGRRIYGRNKG